MNDASTTDSTTSISQMPVSAPMPIPFDLFSKKLNKTTKLISNNSSDNYMKGRNDWYVFQLLEPVFVTSVVVYASEYRFKKCEFRWQTLRGTDDVRIEENFEDGKFKFEINDLVTEFSFRPDSKYFGTTPIIESVVAEGFLLSWLDDIKGELANLEEVKAKATDSAQKVIDEANEKSSRISDLESRISELKADTQAAQTTKSELEAEIKATAAQRDTLNEAISKQKAELSAIESRVEQQQATIEQRNDERERLGSEINAKTAELKDLESDIYLFPSELSEFANKSGKDKAFYWKLAAVPLFILTSMTGALLFNAANLSTVLDEVSNARIFSILITRLPYVAVATTIIAVSYKIAQSLISEIMRIDVQNRVLAQMSIIATDISASSGDGLNLSSEELYKLRTALKMELLREHLKAYLPKDFEYSQADTLASHRQRASSGSNPDEADDSQDGDDQNI